MASGAELLRQAAEGSVAAQLGLIDLALAAGASGFVRQIEGLIAAETWARLAASAGGESERRALAGVLLARAEFEEARSNDYNANWYRDEANKLLGACEDDSASPGDDPAADQLARRLEGAAKGNLVALCQLYDAAAQRILADKGDPIEALVAGELYSRLGSESGDADQLVRLSAILIARSRYEFDAGAYGPAASAIGEAAIILAGLAETGNTEAASWLAEASHSMLSLGIAAAAKFQPAILKYIPSRGNC